jgi:hypothetical protein
MLDRSRFPLSFSFVVPALVAFAAFAVAFAPPASAADVIVVALDGSGDTMSVDIALQLAGPGDVILIRAGNYQPISPLDPEGFHDVSFPVTIVGDGAGAVIGMLRVRDLNPGEEVVLRNLTLAGPLIPGSFFEKVGVRNCAGAVVFEDCKATGITGTSSVTPGFPAVDVRNSDAVTFTRCTLRGGAGITATGSPFFIDAGPGGPAMLVTDSKVAFHHSAVTGGAAGTDTVGTVLSQTGGDALHIFETSTIFVAGGSVTGGKGNDGGDPGFPAAAAGGDGLVLDGLFSLVRLVGMTPAGGEGGTLADASSAPDGEAQVVTAGAVETYGETARGTTMPALLHEAEATTLGISGAPGELGKIMVGIELVHAQLGGKKGVFNLGGTFFGPLVLGTIPPSGLLEVPVSFPRGRLLGLEGLRIDFQTLTFGAEGLMFGNPTSTVLLGAGF